MEENGNNDDDNLFEKYKINLDKKVNEIMKENYLMIKNKTDNLLDQINDETEKEKNDFSIKWNSKFSMQNSKLKEISSQNIKFKIDDEDNNFIKKNSGQNINENNFNKKDNNFDFIKDNKNNDIDNPNILNNEEELEFSLELLKENIYSLKAPILNGINDKGELNGLLIPILYCLCQNQSFINCFIENGIKIIKKFNNNKNYLTPLLLQLIINLWKENENNVFNPSIINQLLSQNNLDNPNKIINHIFFKLDEELQDKNNKDIKLEFEDEYDIFDPQKSFNNYKKYFDKKLYVYLSKHFFSYFQLSNKCSECQVDSFTYEPFVAANIYLESGYFNEENEFSDELTKIDLQENLRVLVIKGNEIKMDQCKICFDLKRKNVTRVLGLTNENLIFTIDRTQDRKNIMKLCYKEKLKVGENNYQLNALIKKKNEYNNKISYLSYFRSFINKKWYCQYKERVQLVNYNENEIFDFKNICVLFYIRDN